MKCCNLVKAKRMRTMKLSVCCYVTRKDTRANFCFGWYHLNFIKNLRQSKLCIVCFFLKKWTSFSWYYCLAETKNLFLFCIFCVFFILFFSYQKKISNIKTTEIHTACHTLDNLWTFLSTVYQQCEKNIGKKEKKSRLFWPPIFYQ